MEPAEAARRRASSASFRERRHCLVQGVEDLLRSLPGDPVILVPLVAGDDGLASTELTGSLTSARGVTMIIVILRKVSPVGELPPGERAAMVLKGRNLAGR
jgi:hypothetical protein